MPAIHARNSTVLTAALVVTGAAGALAQGLQLPAGTTEADRNPFIESKCGPIPKADVGCIGENSIAFSKALAALKREEAKGHREATADHQKATAELREEGRCVNTIADAITSKRITPADLRAAKKIPTETDNACEWLRRLRPQLGALAKE